MNLTEEAAKEYVDELEEEAVEIELDIRELFDIVIEIESSSSFHGSPDKVPKWDFEGEDFRSLQRDIRESYQKWHVKSKEFVKNYFPDRINSMNKKYARINQYLKFENIQKRNPVLVLDEIINGFDDQRNLVKSVPGKIKANKFQVRKQISGEIEKDEIYRAKRLFDDDLVRSSGVIAGVALERHLLTRCEISDDDLDYEYDDGIQSLAQTLYEADELPKKDLKKLNWLSDIRADCAHANEKEPDRGDVERLINEAEEYIRA